MLIPRHYVKLTSITHFVSSIPCLLLRKNFHASNPPIGSRRIFLTIPITLLWKEKHTLHKNRRVDADFDEEETVWSKKAIRWKYSGGKFSNRELTRRETNVAKESNPLAFVPFHLMSSNRIVLRLYCSPEKEKEGVGGGWRQSATGNLKSCANTQQAREEGEERGDGWTGAAVEEGWPSQSWPWLEGSCTLAKLRSSVQFASERLVDDQSRARRAR